MSLKPVRKVRTNSDMVYHKVFIKCKFNALTRNLMFLILNEIWHILPLLYLLSRDAGKIYLINDSTRDVKVCNRNTHQKVKLQKKFDFMSKGSGGSRGGIVEVSCYHLFMELLQNLSVLIYLIYWKCKLLQEIYTCGF